MDFFWPERNRGYDDVAVHKMFEIVDKKKRSLLENLEISPQLMNAPADLLTVYAIYDVFSVKGEKREYIRERFLERYKSRLIHYLENRNSLPEYRSFVWKLFCDLFDVKLKREIECMDLDSYLSKKNDFESILNIIGGGVEIKSWDEFKEIFLKKCRELYPYAEKRLDKIGNIKSFNKEILNLFFEKEKDEILGILSEVIDDEVKILEERRETEIRDLENKILELGESKELLGMLKLLKNGEGKIFIEISWMIKTFSIFDAEDFDIEQYFLNFYVKNVMNRFKESSDRRNPANSLKNKSSSVKIDDKLVNYVQEAPVFFGGTVRKISLEKEKIIDSIVKCCGLGEKNGKSLKKYLIRLLANGRNCRLSSLKNAFGIIKIDENMQNLFGELGIDIEYDISNEGKGQDESIVKAENDEVMEEIKEENLSSESEIINLSLDPVTVCFDQISKYNYEVINERKLKKQIEELCGTDSSIKQILCIEMLKDLFGNPKKKRGDYYTIEIGTTGIRFILFKSKDGKFIIDGVYNHDDYEKRVKEMR